MKIFVLCMAFVSSLATNAAPSKSELVAALRTTHNETFEAGKYYENVAQYEVWVKDEFPKWKTKWGLLTKDIDQFITSKSGKDKDIAKNTVELLKLQIKLFDGQNINNPAALDSLSSVATSSRAIQGQLQSLKFYLPGKKDSQSLLIEFAKALESAANISRPKLEFLAEKKKNLATFKNTLSDRKTRQLEVLCAQLKTRFIKSLPTSDANALKQIVVSSDKDSQTTLCNKYLEKRAGKMVLSAFTQKILQEEASARTQEDKAISDEQNYLKRKKRLLKVEKLGEALPNASCSTRIVGDSPYAVKTDETLSANKIDLAPRLYEKLIEASVTENITSPLIELTAENNRKILVRYQPNSNLREGITVSSAISKLLGNPSKVKAKWCLGIPTASKLYFIAFDAENIADVKTKVHAQLESALENYGGLTLGLKLVVQIEERAVTLVIEKIEDPEGNNVSAVQIPVALEADFEVRTEVEAFDSENNLIPITDENN